MNKIEIEFDSLKAESKADGVLLKENPENDSILKSVIARVSERALRYSNINAYYAMREKEVL